MHGFRGEPSQLPMPVRPRGLTVCISREAGARGGSIARRVGEQLGWQVYNQEMLGYLSQNEVARQEVLADIPLAAHAWIDGQLARLSSVTGRSAADWEAAELIRLIFGLAIRGEAIIVGRGAGALLPIETTLNVRIVAPVEQRVAYMSQWLRLPMDEASHEVASRDRVRAAWHTALANRELTDLSQYDLVLNAGRLGVAACAELIAEAVRGKHHPSESTAANGDWPVVDPV